MIDDASLTDGGRAIATSNRQVTLDASSAGTLPAQLARCLPPLIQRRHFSARATNVVGFPGGTSSVRVPLPVSVIVIRTPVPFAGGSRVCGGLVD